MTTAMAIPAIATPSVLDILIAWMRAFVESIFRPRLTGFAFADGDGGEGGDGGGEGGDGGDGTGDGSGDADEGDDDEDDDEIANLDPKSATKMIRKARQEAKNLRERAKKAEDALAEKRKAEMSEADRLKAEAEEAKAKASAADTRVINAEIKVAAAQAGVVDPDAVAALINREGITLDDSGNVKGVKKALDALLKDKPYLKSQGGAGRSGGEGGGSGEQPPGGGNMDSLIRRGAGFGG